MMPYTKRHFDQYSDRILAPVLTASSCGVALVYSSLVLFLSFKKDVIIEPFIDLMFNIHFLPFTAVALGFFVWDTIRFRNPTCLDEVAGRETHTKCKNRAALYGTLGGIDLALVCMTALLQTLLIFIAIRDIRRRRQQARSYVTQVA
jgi:hypothetical protein